jgi:hypothetical protein
MRQTERALRHLEASERYVVVNAATRKAADDEPGTRRIVRNVRERVSESGHVMGDAGGLELLFRVYVFLEKRGLLEAAFTEKG